MTTRRRKNDTRTSGRKTSWVVFESAVFLALGLTALRQARPEGHECSPLLLAKTCLFLAVMQSHATRTFSDQDVPLLASSSGYCSTRSSSTRSHSPQPFQNDLPVPTPIFRACFQAHHARTRSGFGRLRASLRAFAGHSTRFLQPKSSSLNRLSECVGVKCAIPNRAALLEPIFGGVSPTLSSASSFAGRSFVRRISRGMSLRGLHYACLWRELEKFRRCRICL